MSTGFKKLEEEKPKLPKKSWVETATEIFAFLNIIVFSICLATCLGLIGCTTISHLFTNNKEQTLLWYLCLGSGVSTSIAFVFAVLLFLGVYQKNPGFVLAYFIFGLIVLTLIVSAVVSFEYLHLDIDQYFGYKVNTYNDLVLTFKWVLIGISIVYTFVLVMVCYTYVVMRSNQKRKGVVHTA